jgi:hypothetical protein
MLIIRSQLLFEHEGSWVQFTQFYICKEQDEIISVVTLYIQNFPLKMFYNGV